MLSDMTFVGESRGAACLLKRSAEVRHWGSLGIGQGGFLPIRQLDHLDATIQLLSRPRGSEWRRQGRDGGWDWAAMQRNQGTNNYSTGGRVQQY
jgi:hypothetical protein